MVADRIKQLRLSNNMTQTELAKKLIPYGITCHGDFVDFNEEFLISNILNALKRIMPNVQINVELKHFDC